MKILLIDTSALWYRSKLAIERNNVLINSHSQIVSGCYGSLTTLLKLINQYGPFDHGAAALDRRSFRKDISSDYKANRGDKPSNYFDDLKLLQDRGLPAIGFQTIGVEGYEADDVINSLAQIHVRDDVLIVTVDRDLLGLTRLPKTRVLLWNSSKKKTKLYARGDFEEEFGFSPEIYPQYKAIIGDSSDNIGKIKGYGPKKAKALLETEDIKANLKPEDVEIYERNLSLVTLADIPPNQLPELSMPLKIDNSSWLDMCEELEFPSLVKYAEEGNQL